MIPHKIIITTGFDNRYSEKYEPITSEQIAERLNLTRSALRSDLAVLTMVGVLEARPRVGYFSTGKIPKNLMSERINDIKVDSIKECLQS